MLILSRKANKLLFLFRPAILTLCSAFSKQLRESADLPPAQVSAQHAPPRWGGASGFVVVCIVLGNMATASRF